MFNSITKLAAAALIVARDKHSDGDVVMLGERTLFGAVVPLLEVSANQNEAPGGDWRLADMLDMKLREVDVSLWAPTERK